MSGHTNKPAPVETGKVHQKDDNIDDLGRKPDGSVLDQPVHPEGEKPGDRKSGSDAPDPDDRE